jgi:hypothetical protein
MRTGTSVTGLDEKVFPFAQPIPQFECLVEVFFAEPVLSNNWCGSFGEVHAAQ